MATDPNSVTKSGITVDSATGERYIPSSVRADGTKRREIRVRPGYRPPEDVELYKNRAAAAWKNRGQGQGIPGAEGLKNDNNDFAAKGGSGNVNSAASNKNAKRREAKKKTKAAEDEPDSTADGGGGGGSGRNIAQLDNWRSFAASAGGDTKKTDGTAEQPAEEDPEAEQEKKARNLKKKLRQARDLRDKKNLGESLLPEQLDKIIKINELVRQLGSLGFDSNGDKKGTDGEKGKETERA